MFTLLPSKDKETISFITTFEIKYYLSIKASNLCLSVGLCLCVCICASNISADQDQTDLRVSTWLLLGSRVCNFGFVWIAMIL